MQQVNKQSMSKIMLGVDYFLIGLLSVITVGELPYAAALTLYACNIGLPMLIAACANISHT